MDPKTINHCPWHAPGANSEPLVRARLGAPTASGSLFSRFGIQTLCRGGWEASFEELRDVDHFEIIWNLTRKDYVLTQVRRARSPCTAWILP